MNYKLSESQAYFYVADFESEISPYTEVLMNKISIRILITFIAFLYIGCASVKTYIGNFGEIHANGNTKEAIRTEIASDEFMAILSKRTNTAEWRIRLYSPVVELQESLISYHKRSPSDIRELTMRYIQMRLAGHSRSYAMARLETEPDIRSISQDCQAILNKDREVYLPWLQLDSFKVNDGTSYASYVIVDGEIAWSYIVSRRDDRTLINCYTDWFDAKDVLPEYRTTFEEVHRQVMKEREDQGHRWQFGSIHSYWARKKELLKKRGIEWRSPKELHPNTNYD